MSLSAESLVEERVMQLQEISKRRNELLREMYHLIQKRDNLGSVISVEEDNEDSLQLFLDRFDLEKHPETGYISTLLEDEVALPDTPPAYSPVGGPEPVSQPESVQHVTSESPMSEPPASPPTNERREEEEEEEEGREEEEEEEEEVPIQVQETPREDVPMEVDVLAPRVEAQPELSHEEQPAVEPMDSGEPPQSPSAALEVPTPSDLEIHPTPDEGPTKSPTPTPKRSPTPPHVALSQESPVPQSPTVSLVKTREPSLQVSPPVPQRLPSPSQPAHDGPSAIKPEPLEEVMEFLEPEPQRAATSEPPVESIAPWALSLSAPAQVSKQPSEDQMMAILGPSQPRSSPPPVSEDHYPLPGYSIPLPTLEPSVDFSFDNGADQVMVGEQNPKNPYSFGPEPPYPLPRLTLLPIEFSRKKLKRRRDKGEGKREEWQPMPLNKWAAVLKANPVHTKLARATKCLSTRDWAVGFTEIHLMRVFDRIDQLKGTGLWSFRQPKKQRGVGGLLKTHWDYLIDEMKWMRTDFREERRWKLTLAYTLAHAVVEWHEAGSLEERVRRGIVVRWKPPPLEDTDMGEPYEGDQVVDGPFRETQDTDENGVDSRETGTPLDGYGSDDESEDEPDKERQDVFDSLEPGAALQEALEQLEQGPTASAQPSPPDEVTLKPKVEEIEDMTALGDNSASREESAMDVDVTKAVETQAEKSKGTVVSNPEAAVTHPGLKSTSRNPVLWVPGKDAEGAHGKTKMKMPQHLAVRDRILYADVDRLFIDLDDLELAKGMSELSTNDHVASTSAAPPPPPHDLAAIFPDLPLYTMFDVAPPPTFAQEGKKKSDRKGEKDDPNKRADDATYTKVALTNKFMFVKPTLVGTLKPASHYKDGHWTRVEETPVFADVDVPPARPIDENLCALFEGTGTKSNVPSGHPAFMPPPRDVRKRNAEHADAVSWTAAEDALLKQAVDKYQYNWHLIADAFNSYRVTISTDKRTPWECLERWREKFSAAARGDTAEDNGPSAASTSASAAHMTTRGYKRSATQMTASGSGAANSATLSEPRKRRRHAAMYDTLRKTAKRREAMQKSNAAPRAKPTAVHDTHGQFQKLPKLTPAELSRMKADKEARDAQELLMRRRNDELARQHLLREQAQRAQGLPPSTPQPPQPQQGQALPQGANANGATRPANGVPQTPLVQPIRSQVGISQQQQQQRLAAALANANARMSPPQLTPQQAAQFRAMAAAQGQGQPHAQGQAAVLPQTPVQAQTQIPPQSNASAALTAAAPALSAAHLSPSFTARATSSSPGVPQQSPPLPAASPVNANVVPRPPSVPGQPVQATPVNPLLQMPNLQYYMNLQMQGSRVTPEQLQALLAQQVRQQQQYAAHAAQQQQPPQSQNPANGSFPHS